MSASILQKIRRGVESLPPRIVLSGQEKIGKSTFAAQAPSPLFICAEDGLTGLEHIARWQPATYADLKHFLDALTNEGPGDFKTLVIDTADWLERLLEDHLCKGEGVDSIKKIGGGWGNGEKMLEHETSVLLNTLDHIRQKHQMAIIILSHVVIRAAHLPTGESFDAYEMKGSKKFTGILREWPDFLLFARHEVFVAKDKGAIKGKAVTGDRVIHTQPSATWQAGCRYELPEMLNLSYAEFDAAMREASPGALRAKVKALHSTAVIDDAKKPQWETFVNKVDTFDPAKLKAAIERLQDLQPKLAAA
jgi:hypothetical protein